jgi:CRISPR-associated protein Cas1
MPTLILDGDSLSIRVESKRLKVIRSIIDEEGKRGQNRTDIPLHDIDRVIIIGRPGITVPVLQRLMFNNIPCYFTTSKNRWIGSLLPDNNKDAARRLRQYEFSRDSELRLKLARIIIADKIRNSRRVLQRLAANRVASMFPEQIQVCDELKKLGKQVRNCGTRDELRGIEGMAAALYFKRVGAFFPEEIPFTTRSRRPPKDPANALLSWTYTIVMGEIECEIRTRGLDPCIGFLHEISHGSPSLALDLLEPLRAPLCDLLTLNLLNHGILSDESFEYRTEEGGFFLRQDAHRDFFMAYERAMTRKFKLTKEQSHTDFRRIISDMVSSLLNAMNGVQNISFFKMP